MRIKQVMNNLISNALKFTNTGRIELNVSEKERQQNTSTIAISVRDTGIGIEPSKIESIFKPFTQSDASTALQFGGTGLGLSIVKMLVELHGGKIFVLSEVAKGTEVRIEIPLTHTVHSENTSIKIDPLKNPIISNKRVLVVDDNEHNRFLSETFLTRNGAIVTCCSSAKKAINLLQKGILYDLILMDVQMPIMSGIEAAVYIRSSLGLNIPIVACSAHVLESEKALCFEAGMNAYLLKPYSEAELISCVAENIKASSGSGIDDNEPNDDFIAIFNEHKENLGDEDTRRLIELMVNRIARDYPPLKAAIAENQFSILAQLSHGLAGSMAGMKLTEGLSMARNIEYAAKEENGLLVSEYFERLKKYFDRFEQFALDAL
jgi:CheY-like chemotaxis protein